MKTPSAIHKLRYLERSPRYPANTLLELRTFGSSFVSEVEAIDISRTGILVCAFAQFLPFQVNTILEVRVDPAQALIPKTIEFLAKVARVEHIACALDEKDVDHDVLLFGMMITEIDQANLKLWEEYVAFLESRFPLSETIEPKSLITKCMRARQKNIELPR